MQHKRRAFTLVELLVVIGIIALLIAILLPALSMAQDRARTVACMSQLRQMGLAVLMYADGNKQSLPPHRYATFNGTPAQASRWEYTNNQGYIPPASNPIANAKQDFYPKLFADILVDAKLISAPTFDCPGKPNDGGAGTAMDEYGRISYGGKASTNVFNYAANLYLNGDSGSIAAGMTNLNTLPSWERPIPLNRIKGQRSQSMLYGDSATWATYIAYYQYGGRGMHNKNRGVNFLFFDGHVEIWDLQQNALCFDVGYASIPVYRQFWLYDSYH